MRKWGFIYISLFYSIIPLTGQDAFKNISDDSQLNLLDQSYGIYVGDYNQDNLEDLLITYNYGNPHLYKNLGGAVFKDVTVESGLTSSSDSRTAIWVDFDNDGDLDILLGGRTQQDRLYRNDQNVFSDVSNEMNIKKISRTWSVNISDINTDNYPDIYNSNFLENNTLYQFDGEKFTDVVSQYKLWENGLSMGSIFFDFDNDGDDDLYLVHDGDSQANVLYRKEENGSFTDVSQHSGSNIKANGMGVDIGDINNDGCLDMYITNLYENNLLVNNCDGTFTDISNSAGVADNGMGWGTSFFDYDNDGFLDIIVCNDSYYANYPNVLYKNNGDLSFTPAESIFNNKIDASYGCAIADLDHDGKLDLIIANIRVGESIDVYKNETKEDNNWVGFFLEGTHCNVQAIGARVEVITDSGMLKVDQVTGGNGYASQESPIIHFGIGKSKIDSLRIFWPGGNVDLYDDIGVNQYYFIKQGNEPQLLYNQRTSTLESEMIDVKIYPNPVKNELRIEFNQSYKSIPEISFYSIDGELIESNIAVLRSSEDQFTLPIPSNIKPGMYILKIQSEKSLLGKKICVLH